MTPRDRTQKAAEQAVSQAVPADSPSATAVGPDAAEAGGILTINLDALVANYRLLTRHATPAECAAVVKANGYGCGIEPITRALAKAGCKTFFVAQLSEAKQVRAVAPEAVVYVLNGFSPGTAASLATVDARPVIGSLAELVEWDAFVTASNWRGGAALHVDTGMNRLGLSAEEAAALSNRVHSEHHGIALIMSHFACAETPDHPLNDHQIRLFREIRTLFRGIPASLANSSGIFLGSSAHCDMVRPGAALYGINPLPGRANPMQNVVGLKGRIMQVRNLARGATIGYGATWTAPRPSRIAIVAVGYGDGYLRAASGSNGNPGGEVVVAGRRCSIVGRISMDLLALDVTDTPDNAVHRGDFVTLIGDGLDIDEVGAKSGTIGYEMLTSLGHRYARLYSGG